MERKFVPKWCLTWDRAWARLACFLDAVPDMVSEGVVPTVLPSSACRPLLPLLALLSSASRHTSAGAERLHDSNLSTKRSKRHFA